MTQIKNINSEFGMEITFDGIDINDCLEQMRGALADCDIECEELVLGVDYEITAE